jgi:NADH-quinone oxidoreductase subunit A
VRSAMSSVRGAGGPFVQLKRHRGLLDFVNSLLAARHVAGRRHLLTTFQSIPRYFYAMRFGTPRALIAIDFEKAVLTMWTLVAYFGFVIFLVGAVLIGSYLLGPRHSEPATGDPYEGGIVSEGSARVRVSVKYYMIAMFFVVFDLEAVFLFAWAGAVRELGWAGYWEVVAFVGVLLATLIYLAKIGALDWTRGRLRSR